jgi:hypothetical protein
MSPLLSRYDEPHQTFAESVFSGQGVDRLSTGGVVFTDAADNFRGQFCAWSILPAWSKLQAVLIGMDRVCGWRNVFKIVRPVILFVAVLVINLQAVGAWPDEGGGNEPVNKKVASSRSGIQAQMQIAFAAEMCSQYPTLAAPRRDGISADIAEIGDAVMRFPADDGLPDFAIIIVRHGGLLSSSLCLGPDGEPTPPRPALYQALGREQAVESLDRMEGVIIPGPHRWIARTPSSWVAGSFDTGLLPGSNEVVIFDGSGQGSVVGGLNQTAIDLDRLELLSAYGGSIGVPGNPLIISADEVIHQGSGTLCYQDGGGTTDLMIVDSPNAVNAAYLGGNTITRARILNGYLEFVSGIGTVTHLELGTSDSPNSHPGPRVAMSDSLGNVGFVTNLRMNNGFLNGNMIAAASTGHQVICGGYWRSPFLGSTGGVYLQTGGTVELYLDQSYASSIALIAMDLHLIGGVLDTRNTGRLAMSGAKIYVWPDATFLYSTDVFINVATDSVRMSP